MWAFRRIEREPRRWRRDSRAVDNLLIEITQDRIERALREGIDRNRTTARRLPFPRRQHQKTCHTCQKNQLHGISAKPGYALEGCLRIHGKSFLSCDNKSCLLLGNPNQVNTPVTNSKRLRQDDA